jgi:glyoxylase-like metal-dependent hydrolase (beta-lactamase superfamily II)
LRHLGVDYGNDLPGSRGMKQKSIGDITISRVIDLETNEHPYQNWFPDLVEADFEAHREQFEPIFFDFDIKRFTFSLHAFVVKTDKHTIVVDTCVGNDKTRQARKHFNMRDDARFMNELAAAGVHPEEVDYVMCTHLHGDHVGWNTRLENGEWVPTFPNAKYLFSDKEIDFWSNIPDDRNHYNAYRDSVLPVIESGNALTVKTDHGIDDSVWLVPAEGHTPGQYSVALKSNGAEAMLSGDVFHHPIQCVRPEISTAFCIDPDAAVQTRLDYFERYADTNMKFFPAHFPAPTAGFIVSHGDTFQWKPDF